MTVGRSTRCLAILITLPAAGAAQAARYSFDDAQAFLKSHCQICHLGTAPAGGFDIQQIASAATIGSEAARWNRLALRVRNGEMPPKGAPVPPGDQREQVHQLGRHVRARNWLRSRVHAQPRRHPPSQP